VAVGVILNILAGLALPFLGSSQAGAFIGLFLFYLTFEFAIVSSIPLMTEVFPPARATLMAGNLAAHSLGRALGALVTAPLFALGQASLSTPDILPSALASAAFNLLGLLALFYLHRRMVRHPSTTPPLRSSGQGSAQDA
jgi:predicted MFS family arabinose efflux permease